MQLQQEKKGSLLLPGQHRSPLSLCWTGRGRGEEYLLEGVPYYCWVGWKFRSPTRSPLTPQREGGLNITEQWQMSWVSTRLLLMLLQQKGRRVEVQVPHAVSSSSPRRKKELAPQVAFSDAILMGTLRYLVLAGQGWNSRFSTWTLLVWMGVGL